MQSTKTRTLSISITLIIAIILALYLRANSHLFLTLKNVSVTTIIELVLLRVLFMVVNGAILGIFIAKFNIMLNWRELIGLPIITALGNYLTPFSGGLVARAAYLKKKHVFPLAQFAALISVTYLVTFWVMGVLGSVLALGLAGDVKVNWLVIVLFLGVASGISLLLALPAVHFSDRNWLLRSINTALEGWELARRDWALLGKLAALSLINVLLHGASFWITYNALGFKTPFISALLVSLMSMFSILINITPANLGIQEAFISASSALLYLDPGESLLVALIIRITTMIPIFILGPLFSYWLTREAAALSENETRSQP